MDTIGNSGTADTSLKFNLNSIVTRSPRLDTVVMVENFIKTHSGQFKKTELLQHLPKKMMWGTFNVILSYLCENEKISLDKDRNIVYIGHSNNNKKKMVVKNV
jgi:hypothetical protein